MILYCDEKGVICDVGENTTGNKDLIRYEVDDKDNPFATWGKGKILCYKVRVQDNHIVMMTPAVDSRLIRNFENTQAYKFTKTAYIDDTEITFYDVPQGNVTVFIDGYSGNYEVVRIQNRLTVKFEPMKKATDVTINII